MITKLNEFKNSLNESFTKEELKKYLAKLSPGKYKEFCWKHKINPRHGHLMTQFLDKLDDETLQQIGKDIAHDK
jgi:hypothetical protein